MKINARHHLAKRMQKNEESKKSLWIFENLQREETYFASCVCVEIT